MNYTFRMHDPRVGRFFALDPLESKYPWNSPYAFSENRVMDGVELEGLEFSVTSDKTQSSNVVHTIHLKFRVINEGDTRQFSNYQAGQMARQMMKLLNNGHFDGYNEAGDYVKYSAEYSESASVSIHIADNFPQNSNGADVFPFDSKDPKTPNPITIVAVGAVPDNQKGDVISGAVYLMSSKITNQDSAPLGLKNAAFTALHELLVHLIEQKKQDGNSDHDVTNLNNALASQFGPKKGSSFPQLCKLTPSQANSNLFQSPPSSDSTLLAKFQQTKILNNVQQGIKSNSADPACNIENNIPVNTDDIVPTSLTK